MNTLGKIPLTKSHMHLSLQQIANIDKQLYQDLERLALFAPKRWNELLPEHTHTAPSIFTESDRAMHERDYVLARGVHYKGKPVYYHIQLLYQWGEQ